MKSAKQVGNNQAQQKPNCVQVKQPVETEEKMTAGQRLADALASKVGSWSFLIGQTGILAGWVSLNLMPGVPHWDESPFILLNLVFSFASAYTAPIVLMSQNRQSDIDRRKAENNHHINLKAGQNIELLHEKLDVLQSRQIEQLTQIVIEQQRSLHELKTNLLPSSLPQQQQQSQVTVPAATQERQYLTQIKITDADGKYLNKYSVYFPFKSEQQVGLNRQENSKVVR
ncbi:DUF1003 domain-containing protein [Iningainema tapete]|uniref:DUF1003 domain-containing protein n=1 Tax=Iningainema tapete BLCC-T55 TaxID=2748662 RepID=A0A8J6XH16_9CYAN|nr:DUF1003 domain-containing protein [Iningainema tapete]MBD2771664.1 DUF1003 domain-containing protein [Iningainema tapete BLCC-T55]